MPRRLALVLIALSVACGSQAGGAAANGPDGGSQTLADGGSLPTVGCPAVGVDRATLLARAAKFSERHGVTTTIAFEGCPESTFATCEPVLPSDHSGIVYFLDQMDTEMAVYPAGFFEAMRLDYFVFGGKLAKNNREHDSLGGAVVYYGDHRSVLLVNTLVTNNCYAPSNKRVVHHEIAHVIDNGFAGVREGNWWATMNPPGFSYGGVDFDAPGITDITHPRSGLVSKYAAWDASEDYAEVFASLHFAEKDADLRAWVGEDRYLRAKMKAVVGALATKWKPLTDALPNRDVAE